MAKHGAQTCSTISTVFHGTLPRFHAWMNDLFQHLTRHWLRLVEESEDANRSRWPMHPTWQQLRDAFGSLARIPPAMTKSANLSVAHTTEAGCACFDGWRRE
jgi:hypothetical protein